MVQIFHSEGKEILEIDIVNHFVRLECPRYHRVVFVFSFVYLINGNCVRKNRFHFVLCTCQSLCVGLFPTIITELIQRSWRKGVLIERKKDKVVCV